MKGHSAAQDQHFASLLIFYENTYSYRFSYTGECIFTAAKLPARSQSPE